MHTTSGLKLFHRHPLSSGMILFVGGVPCPSASVKLGPGAPARGWTSERGICWGPEELGLRSVYVMWVCSGLFARTALYMLCRSTGTRGTSATRTWTQRAP